MLYGYHVRKCVESVWGCHYHETDTSRSNDIALLLFIRIQFILLIRNQIYSYSFDRGVSWLKNLRNSIQFLGIITYSDCSSSVYIRPVKCIIDEQIEHEIAGHEK